MDESVEYFIDERDCLACVNRELGYHEDPCYDCNKSNKHDSFVPDSVDVITDRISEM